MFKTALRNGEIIVTKTLKGVTPQIWVRQLKCRQNTLGYLHLSQMYLQEEGQVLPSEGKGCAARNHQHCDHHKEQERPSSGCRCCPKHQPLCPHFRHSSELSCRTQAVQEAVCRLSHRAGPHHQANFNASNEVMLLKADCALQCSTCAALWNEVGE